DAPADKLGLGARAPLDLAVGLAPQPIRDTPGEMLGVPGDADFAVLLPNHAADLRLMADAVHDAEEGNGAAGAERHRLRPLIEAVADPGPVEERESPALFERGAAREHDNDAAFAMVEAQDDAARPLVGLVDYRDPAVGHRQNLPAGPRLIPVVVCNSLIRKY